MIIISLIYYILSPRDTVTPRLHSLNIFQCDVNPFERNPPTLSVMWEHLVNKRHVNNASISAEAPYRKADPCSPAAILP